MSFQNLYYKRTAGTAKACYVCYRPTTTVLATINTTDFIYTCLGHLADSNFASQVKDSSESGARVQITPEEIAKVKEEWEEKQRRKKEKEKEAAAETEKDKKEEKGDGKEGETDSKDRKTKEKREGESSRAPSTPATPRPTHERYVLHRDFFAMRQAEHRRRRQTAQARELAPRLPGAPGSVI